RVPVAQSQPGWFIVHLHVVTESTPGPPTPLVTALAGFPRPARASSCPDSAPAGARVSSPKCRGRRVRLQWRERTPRNVRTARSALPDASAQTPTHPPPPPTHA